MAALQYAVTGPQNLVGGDAVETGEMPAGLVVAEEAAGRAGHGLSDNRMPGVLEAPFTVVARAENDDAGNAERRGQVRDAGIHADK